jgi:iron(III) transport system substrate-binding protein
VTATRSSFFPVQEAQLHAKKPVARLRSTRVLAATAAVVLGLAACAAPSATDSGQDTAAGSNPCEGSKSAALAEELASLSGKEREDRLVELAAESGEVTLYGELNVDQAGPLIEAFEDKYEDISVNLYRAGTDQIRQRVLEEASANRGEADLIELDATEMAQLDAEGLLIPVSTPLAKDIAEAGQFENYTADRFSYIVPTWNTKKLKPEDIPQTLEDLTDPKYKGRMALEGSDVFWFAGLVQSMEAEGQSREEAVDLFRRIAANSAITDGHTTTSELVVAGEYDLAVNTFAHRTEAFKKEGAPVEWQPAKVPVVAETTTVAIPCASPNPAGALLLQDFFLAPDGAQQLFLELDRTPAHVEVAKEQTGSVEPIEVDVAAISKEFAMWEELWAEVVREGN